jgi:hydrogenase nickel incorporation protein HypA/HybF
MSRDSIAEGAEVGVNFVSPRIECECGYRRDKVVSEMNRIEGQPSIYEYAVMTCPECGKLLHFTGGDELIVQTIDIEI